MKQHIRTLLAGGVLAVALFGVAAAGQLDAAAAGQLKDGLTASARGDYAEAMRLLRPLAEQGDPNAQTVIGLLYGNGRGIPKDYGQALAWFRKAAEQGYEAAQNDLGVMYALGQGAPQDYVQAYMWFDLAASHASDAETRDKAVKNRDEAAAEMTPDQISEAQRSAQAWKPQPSSSALVSTVTPPSTSPTSVEKGPPVSDGQSHADSQRWQLGLTKDDPPVMGICKDANGSPAEFYKASKFLGLNPEIIDKGDEVDISSTAGVVSWFRTIDACQKAAQANIDAARAAAKAESEKLEKYR
jgi:uncharacterized protein